MAGAGFSNAIFNSSPVTPLASVVVNGMIDRYFMNWRAKQTSNVSNPASDLGVYTIGQRELVFRLKNNKDKIIIRPGANGVNDVQLKVFSSFNNWPKRAIGNGVDEPIERSIMFVGVALLPVDYMNKSNKDTLAILVSGSISILNTGDYPIYPGQKVAWMADEDLAPVGGKRQRSMWPEGRPRDKALFKVIPFENMLDKMPNADDRRLGFERLIGVALTGAEPGANCSRELCKTGPFVFCARLAPFSH